MCGAITVRKFTVPLSRGLTGRYFECVACRFLRSDHLDDRATRQRVYETAQSDDDPGAAYRQLCVTIRLTELIRARLLSFGPKFKVLDFGTATGFLPAALAPRMGWDIIGFDAYSKPFYDSRRVSNLWSDVEKHGPYHLVIATEVLEHFTDPLAELNRIAKVMDPRRSFLYATTTLYDPAKCGPDWLYLAPHTAQHCAFYSRSALEITATVLGAELVPLSAPHSNEWLFVRGGSTLRLQARTAAGAIRWLMRHGRIPGF